MNTKQALFICIAIAIASAPFSALLDERYPWIISIPIILGAAMIIFIQIREDDLQNRRL
jgi:hypothetical protein